jgi:hypothetical protein
MPYVCVYDNRYIGEHDCKCYHYGNQSLIRSCCVDDARKQKANVLRVAMTNQHPAYQMFLAAWNSLTEAECWQVGDIRAVYDHGPAGFTACDMQKELPI